MRHAMMAALAAVVWLPAGGAAQQAPMDTAALNALVRMSNYLKGLQEFQVTATGTTDDVLVDGQKVQTAATANLVAVRPNRLRMAVTSDRQQRLYLYDGRRFTLYAPRMKYYATAPAPGSIPDLATQLEDRYGIELPLMDLFRWGSPMARVTDIRSARVIGPSAVGGVTCDHYAFRQDGLDWELWVQRGDHPLPRKLVLTTLTDEARPQHAMTYEWNLAPSYNNQSFTFVAPDDAHAITFAQARASRTASRP